MFFRRKNRPEIKPIPGSIAPAVRPANGRKILLVDDDPVVLTALTFRLRSKGYSVVTAADGSQALTATRKEKPDLMILDVHFPADVGGPDWNGFTLAQWIHREAARNLPVIVMSGSHRPEYPKRASDAGAVAFLAKPLNNDELFGCIDSALRSGAPQASESVERSVAA